MSGSPARTMPATGPLPGPAACSPSTSPSRWTRKSARRWRASSPRWRRPPRPPLRTPPAQNARGIMQPKLELLSSELTARILEEAFQLLSKPGIRVRSQEARELLAAAGSQVDATTHVVRIPEKAVRSAVESMPKVFHLYNRLGEPTVTYGGNDVHFDPGS